MEPLLSRPPNTLADFYALPEGTRAELIRGVLLVAQESPRTEHQRAVGRLLTHLAAWCQAADERRGEVFVGPLDVTLPSGDIVRPDLLFVKHAHAGIVKKRHIAGAPDLIVEVLSPESRTRDVFDKVERYAANGVPEYWTVWPDDQAIQVQRLEDGAYEPAGWFRRGETLVSPAMPGLALPIDEVFPV